ncbi:beta-galactosidase 13-like [Gossypium australe]|uniref:Beta-galactosidase n=1 Tax=Gossypium australe TaxID=47621 RepID=A0A5B6V107_9ROSI|nr:beta-galactosidase 13-like [Gossypium australe]
MVQVDPGRILLITFLSTLLITSSIAQKEEEEEVDPNSPESTTPKEVTYDSRSLLVNGKRMLFFSGSIHYPRSPPDAWPDLLRKAKMGGLNMVETYVFWNVHEPVQGKYNFEGAYDLVKFIKLIQQHKMFAMLRVGPFIQGEWNHGGLPYWLREVPNIIFRCDNEPFKMHMKKFVTLVIEKMKQAKLFAPQGGPIIVSQIENEYNTIQLAFRERGDSYVQWAAKMALSLDTKVPWIMCKQRDAPDPIINTCNGRHCGDTFTGPNGPNKPFLWTENWTAQFRVFGDPPSQRSAEDLAFSIIRFCSKNGTLVNYYMYHGGTNFGRTSSSFTTTRYYDEAPLDEFGLIRQPKWGHLKDAHRAVNLCKRALFSGSPFVQKLGPDQEARVWEQPGTSLCSAFLTNNDTKKPQALRFRGQDYQLPPRSISILPDCKTEVFNSQMITTHHNSRNFVRSVAANKNFNWEMYREVVPDDPGNKLNEPRELYELTKDTSDYAWYITKLDLGRRDLPMKNEILPVLRVASLGHGLHCYVNGKYIGSAHGSKVEKSFVFQRPVEFQAGSNQIALLGFLVGLPDSGAYMEKRYAGPRSITILGLNTGTLDITLNTWSHQVGLDGEKNQIYTQNGFPKVQWVKGGPSEGVTWYKGYFDAPEGDNPVAVKMTGMGKGMIYINGRNIGRYWMSYLSPLKRPTQSEYHIPRSYLKPTMNLIVIVEDEKGDPKDIEIVLVDRDTICGFITEYHLPSVRLFEGKGGKLVALEKDLKPRVELACPSQKQIVTVEFASFGDPFGACGHYVEGNCTSPVAKQVVEKFCLGKPSCNIPLDTPDLHNKNEACPEMKKTLAIQAKCAFKA